MNATLTTAKAGRLTRATVGSVRQAGKFAAEDLAEGADVVRFQCESLEDFQAFEAALRRVSGGARAAAAGWHVVEGRGVHRAIDLRPPAVPSLRRLAGIRPEADAHQVALFSEESGRPIGATDAVRAGL